MQLAAQHPTASVPELISIAQDLPQGQMQAPQPQQRPQPQQPQQHYGVQQPQQMGTHVWSQLSPEQQSTLQSLPDMQRQQVCARLDRAFPLLVTPQHRYCWANHLLHSAEHGPEV